MSKNNFYQLINKPTHIQVKSFSCIDLIFTNQPNLSANSAVHSSLHPNCHHLIVHTSFNLDTYYLLPRKICTMKTLQKNEIIRRSKLKRIAQFLNHFMTTEKFP